ncbi:hypothetical protein KKD03_02730 [Patescibacteria group bacterium]|nr:hypothetical protein [Patescibacteria group bacterium]
MSQSINFVGDRRKRLNKTQKQDKKIMNIMINVLVSIFVIFLVVMGLRIFYVFRLKTVKDQQTDVRTFILSHEAIEKEYIVFAQKLKKLSVFFGKRKDKQEALIFFSKVFGEDVIVSGIDYSSADEDVVSFTIKTPNVFVMERVFKTLEDPKVSLNYPNISKSNMSRSASGNYTLSLAVVLPEIVELTDVDSTTKGVN